MRRWLELLCVLILIVGVTTFAAAATSSFDESSEGWVAVGDSRTVEPVFKSVDGNPGGHVEIDDSVSGGVWFWSAPGKFLGDQSDAYGSVLRFDLRQVIGGPDQFDSDDIIVEGSHLSLVYDLPSNPNFDGSWTSFEVGVEDGASWRIGSRDGALAAADQIRAVLADVSSLRIRGEYQTGSDTGSLDNVVFGVANVAKVAERSLPSSFQSGTPFEVTIQVVPPLGSGVYAVQENLPKGFEVEAISAGGSFDENNRLLKWGPFFDGAARTFGYLLVSFDDAVESVKFSGVVAVGDNEISTGGDSELGIPSPLSAPLESSDSNGGAVRMIGLPASLGSGYVVTIEVVLTSESLIVYAVEEELPDGALALNVSHGGRLDEVNRTVKWGPFFDGEQRMLQYELLLADGFEGAAQLSGTVSIGAESFPIDGESRVDPVTEPLVAPPIIVAQPSTTDRIVGEDLTLIVEAVGDGPLSYQWTNNGVVISGAVDQAYSIQSIAYRHAGIYRVEVSNSGGKTLSEAALVVVEAPFAEPTSPLAQALDAPLQEWVAGGAGQWIVDDSHAYFGDSSVTFANVNHSESTWMETTVDGPGSMTFTWKVSSEDCGAELCDYARFSLNGEVRETIHGEMEWETIVLILPAGQHRLRWDYQKDGFTSSGEDRFWLDGFAFGDGFPLPVAVSGPGSVTVTPSRLLYAASERVILQAIPNEGAAFQAWQDPIHRANPRLEYAVQGFQTVTAAFGDDYGSALDTSEFVWISRGDAKWETTTKAGAVGGLAARSGGGEDEQESSISARFTGPGVLRFRWAVSSEFCAEDPCDFMTVAINGVALETISGEVDWQDVTFHLPAGTHDVVWCYSKDVFTSVGEDVGWLDQVRFEPREVERAEVAGLEYFVGDDPGLGNGIPLSPNLEEFDLPLHDLEPGLHFLNVRAREEVDGETRWSHDVSVPISVRGYDDQQQLTKLEYFFDEDSGAGERRSLPPDTDGVVEIPVEGVAPGYHRLEFRVAESFRGEERWGTDVCVPFEILPSTPTDDIVPDLQEIRFAFLSEDNELTSDFVTKTGGASVFDGEAEILSELLHQPGTLTGRAIAVNVLGQESHALWFTVTVDERLVPEVSPWGAWLSRFFAEADRSNPLIVGPEADPDGDGASNFLEFATGGDPNEPEAETGRLMLSRGTDGIWNMVTRALVGGQSEPDGTYVVGGLRYKLQQADGSFQWETDKRSADWEIGESGGGETLELRTPLVPGPLNDLPIQLYRLIVTPTVEFEF